MARREIWLDAEQEHGDFIVAFPVRPLAKPGLSLEKALRDTTVWGDPHCISSHRDYVLRSLELIEHEHDYFYPGIVIERGLREVLTLLGSELLQAPVPLRVHNPARQSLGLKAVYNEGPFKLLVRWSRMTPEEIAQGWGRHPHGLGQ